MRSGRVEDPRGLLARVEAAQKVAKKGDVVGARVMAEIVGMSQRHLIDRHIKPDADFPVQRHGSQGIDYQLVVKPVLAYMAKKCRERIARADREARDMIRLTGFEVSAEDAGQPLSLADIRTALQVSDQMRAMKAEQGQTMLVAEVSAFLRKYHGIIMQTVLGGTAQMDPTGIWPTDVRAQVEQALRDMASACQAALDDFIKEEHGDPTPPHRRHARRSGKAGR